MASNRREFLQLAGKYADKLRKKVDGWFWSYKLDGTRCFWDGGVTRGMATELVPWASVLNPKKPGERKEKIKPISTGLWSRYGNPIMAPDEFLDGLPPIFLDGELWAGIGNFQLCRSICGGDVPDLRFTKHIKYMVYGAPSYDGLFFEGEIKNANFHCLIDKQRCVEFVQKYGYDGRKATYRPTPEGLDFRHELNWLREWERGEHGNSSAHRTWEVHEQGCIKQNADIGAILGKYVEQGGEGLVIRNPEAVYIPKRTNDLLKWKPYVDDEAVIKGYTSGRETDKGSKHLGRIGAIITEYNGKPLNVSGLTDEERLFKSDAMRAYAEMNPDKDMPEWFEAKHFKVGQTITFKYRELSDDGIPKEASFVRDRSGEE